MFARLFRFSDRFGKLSIKVSLWLSEQLIAAFKFAAGGIKRRNADDPLDVSTQAESQVQSLSGLTVILLAAVVVLIFWATNSSGQGTSGIQFLAIESGQQAQAEQPSIATQPSAIIAAPQIRSTGTIVFSMFAGKQRDLFALTSGQPAPIRLTDDPADDRDPVWSPDGQRLAFSSQRDGNWELYILDMQTGQITRLTYDTAFDANPTWSPDGLYIAYETYSDGNLDIYLRLSDGSGDALPLTQQPGADFAPAWFPQDGGRTLAYVSIRDGVQDIYLMSLDNPGDSLAQNLTNTPALNETEPVWSPDGTSIAYETTENGLSLVYSLALTEGSSPIPVGQGHSPSWSPDGAQLVYFTDNPAGAAPTKSQLRIGEIGVWGGGAVAPFDLPALADGLSWTAAGLPAPQGTIAFAMLNPIPSAFNEPVSAARLGGAPYEARTLPGVDADSAYLSDRVDGSFMTLRDHINEAAGWDFLGRLDGVFWTIDRPLEPGKSERNWHKAGRAFDVVENYNNGSSPPQIELVPEQIGAETYWRMYVRAAKQDGSLGEPLRALPWDFIARGSGDVEAYTAGGRFKDTIPSGYYIDFTQMALIYGWTRAPSDPTWRSVYPGVLFWQYEKRDGLDWWPAMLELYTEDQLNAEFSGVDTDSTVPQNTSIPPTGTPSNNPTPTVAPTSEEDSTIP